MLAAAANESVFDFREVGKVVQDEKFQVSGFRFQAGTFMGELETLNLKRETHFVLS